MYRDHFTRALELGFNELEIVSEDRPLICRDGPRTYLTMPLDKKDALAAGENPLRIVSGEVQPPMKVHQPKREKTVMSTPSTNRHVPTTETRPASSTTPASNRIGLAALIMDAQSLKESARITFNQASRLLVALVRHRKQSKLMVSTLKSLKELQTIDA